MIFDKNLQPRSGTKILIVADDLALTRQLFPVLCKCGMDCYYASDGAYGLESILELKPHLILVDTCLPDLDIYPLCVGMRRLSRAPILLMGVASERHLLHALGAGADGLLCKPCQPTIWVARIEAQLRRVFYYDAAHDVSKPLAHPVVLPPTGEIKAPIDLRRSLRFPTPEKVCRLCANTLYMGVENQPVQRKVSHARASCPHCKGQGNHLQLAPAA